MKDKNIEKNKSRLKIYYSLLITIICIIGVSFAWFRLYLSQSENNTLASRTCFNTTLTEETSKIALTDEFPIVDEKGLKKTPFTFTVKNNCSGYVKMYITIDSTYRTSTSSSYLKDNYIKVNLSPKGTTDNNSVILGKQSLTDLDNNSKGYILLSTGLKAKEEKSYDLRIWMDEAVTAEQGLNKSWSGKIVVVTSAAVYKPSFAETILANNEVQTPLTEPGKEVSAYVLDDITETSTTNLTSAIHTTFYITYGTGYEANGDKFNLTGAAVTSDTYANSYSSLVGKYLPYSSITEVGAGIAGTMKNTTNLDSVYYVVSATDSNFTYKQITSNNNITEALLASAEDDYGTSYYFRGAVTNNYVEFANKCWRVVRITGDGSAKLVLHNDNISNVTNPCSSANNSDTAAFARYSGTDYISSFNLNSDDNAYVGFMYGTVGASDYASTHANINKSEILTNLDTWYANNLTPYTDKIADTIWCNDKSNITDTAYNPLKYNNVTGLGYSKNITYYGTTKRLEDGNGNAGGTGPSLKCNGKLSKITTKTGLLTADELAYAGYIASFSSSTNYLQENTGDEFWWSLSPYDFDGEGSDCWYIGNGEIDIDYVHNAHGIRPSIVLISSTTISGGSGTSEDPYIVK